MLKPLSLKKTTLSFFVLFFLSGFGLLYAESCETSICFPDFIEIGGKQIPKRGSGLLEFLKFDMYTAALYVPAEVEGVEGVLADVPKRLELYYHRNIKVEWMNKAAEKVMRKNPAVDFDAVEARVQLISAAYQKVSKGDRYALQYDPGQGTTLFLNDSPQISLPGYDFAKAYFGIWLSEYPANEELRDKLIQ